MKKFSRIILGVFVLTIGILLFQETIFAGWQGSIGGTGGNQGGSGTTANVYITNSGAHAMRVYMVKQVGGSVTVVSNVKDFRKQDGWQYKTVLNYSTSGNGLGTRFGSNLVKNNSGYNAHVVTKSSQEGVPLPTLYVEGAGQAVRNFFLALNRNQTNCSPNCLHKFLVETLGVNSELKGILEKQGDVSNYFIVVEPVHYFWKNPSGNAIAFSSTDGAKFYKDFVSGGIHNVQSRIFNHSPLTLVNLNSKPLNALSAAGTPLKPWCSNAAVCYSNRSQYFYTSAQMMGSSGLGIGYLWAKETDLGKECDPKDPKNPCEDDDEDIPKTCASMMSNISDYKAYWDFVRWGLNKTDKDYKMNCCSDFKNYIERQKATNPTSLILSAHQVDYELYCESPTTTVPPPTPKDPQCAYSVLVSCPECTEIQSGAIKDIDNWDCIFLSDRSPNVPVQFRNHYIQASIGDNRYCKVYCREEMGYVFPEETFTVKAGLHFTMGSTSVDTPFGIPNWGNAAFQGTANCMPDIKRDKKIEPLAGIDRTKTGDHDDLHIDHVKFTHDWKDVNIRLGTAWDKWQVGVLQDWTKNNAQYAGRDSSCGLVFNDSESRAAGCVDENKIYSCSYGKPKDGSSNNSRKTIFECRHVVPATAHYTCSSGTFNGVDCDTQCTRMIDCYNSVTKKWEKCPQNYSCSVAATFSHYTCDEPQYDKPLPGDSSQCYYDFTSDSTRWQCNSTSGAYYQRVRTPSYNYNNPNIRGNESSGSYNWCTIRSDVNYDWTNDPNTASGFTRRFVSNTQVSSLSSNTNLYDPAPNTARRPATRPSVNSLRNAYDVIYREREGYLQQIRACQNYDYNYNHLNPQMRMGYNDFKYPLPPDVDYALESKITETSEIDYLVKGQYVSSSSDVIDRFSCNPPTTPATTTSWQTVGTAVKCPITKQDYPDNDAFFYTKDRVINYELNQNINRFVIKHSEKGNFTDDSVSVHRRPATGNYIDIGYPNLPVHYFQGDHYPDTSQVWIRLVDVPSPSLGSNNRFDKFIFGQYKPATINARECMRYECDYNITYRFIPPDDGNPNPGGPNPGDPTGVIDILVKFRPIDLGDPFPGHSGTGRTPGWNWNSDNVITQVISNNRGVTEDRLYRDRNPMYTIDLRFNAISAIRSYNRNRDYNDFTLTCRTGLTGNSRHRECRSTFVNQFVKRDSCLSTWNGCH